MNSAIQTYTSDVPPKIHVETYFSVASKENDNM